MIETRNLGYSTDVTIVSGISLTVAPGGLTALVGPNGAGKSTLMALAAGLLRPTEGEVSIGGALLSGMALDELARLRAYLPPDNEAVTRFTVREVVEMGRHPWKQPEDDSGDRAAEVMEALDLTHLADRRFSSLSTGEAKRARIAVALAQDTPVLLLDEPLTGLDLPQTGTVLRHLRHFARSGRTVLMVVHDLVAAANSADRLILMSGGAVVADGLAEEVLTASRLSAAYSHPVVVERHGLGSWFIAPDLG